jgi:hypothetical protein
LKRDLPSFSLSSLIDERRENTFVEKCHAMVAYCRQDDLVNSRRSFDKRCL